MPDPVIGRGTAEVPGYPKLPFGLHQQALFDDVVGASEGRRRHGGTEHLLADLQIDDHNEYLSATRIGQQGTGRCGAADAV